MNNQMGGNWKIVNFDNHAVTSMEMFNKEWDVNSPKSTKATIMIDMLEFAKESKTSQLKGELILNNDNKFLHNSIIENGRNQDTM